MPIVVPSSGGLLLADLAVSPIFTLPPSLDMATTETLPYIVDVSNYMTTGDIVVVTGIAMFKNPNGSLVEGAWYGTPTVNGNVVSFPIFGSFLKLGSSYQVQVTIRYSPVKTLTYLTFVNVIA